MKKRKEEKKIAIKSRTPEKKKQRNTTGIIGKQNQNKIFTYFFYTYTYVD